MRIKNITLLALLIFVAQTNVSGDSETRTATLKEKSFYNEVMNVFKSSLPSGPAGWEITRETEIIAPERVAKGIEQSPYYLNYHIAFSNRAKLRETELKRDKAVQKNARVTEPAVNEAQKKKFEKLSMEMGKAAEKGDMAKVTRLQKEMEKIARQMEKSFYAKDEEIKKMLMDTSARDAELHLILSCNSFCVSFYGNIRKDGPIGKHSCVYRKDGDYTDGGEWREGETVVVLGDSWKYVRSGTYPQLVCKNKTAAPHTRAYAIVVKVKGDETRAREYLEKINWIKLENLLNR